MSGFLITHFIVILFLLADEFTDPVFFTEVGMDPCRGVLQGQPEPVLSSAGGEEVLGPPRAGSHHAHHTLTLMRHLQHSSTLVLRKNTTMPY